MKIKEGFILREVAGENIVIACGEELNLNMMITLNDTGRFLWEHLEKDTTVDKLVAAICREYDVSEEQAKASVIAFVDKLSANGFLE